MSRDRNERDQEHHAGEKFGRHPICQIRRIMALTYILYAKICIFQLFFQKKLPATFSFLNSKFKCSKFKTKASSYGPF